MTNVIEERNLVETYHEKKTSRHCNHGNIGEEVQRKTKRKDHTQFKTVTGLKVTDQEENIKEET